MNENLIFTIPLFDQWLLHAPLHGITALLNNSMICRLKSKRFTEDSDDIRDLVKPLSTQPVFVPGIATGAIDPFFLGFIPTRACNMSCRYCDFGSLDADSVTLNPQLAIKAVDWMASYAGKHGKKTLNIHFFGGEPFIVPDVIEKVVFRTRQMAQEKGMISWFEASTNGCFSERTCRFVANHFNAIVLSFDGPEEIQNLHRPLKKGTHSFDTVSQNALMLSKSQTELYIRACVTDDSIKSLTQTTEWFCKTYRPSVLNFEPLQKTPRSKAAGLIPPNPWDFAKMVQKASRISSSFGIPTMYNSASIHRLRNTFCPVGKDALIISPKGQVNACYLLQKDWKDCGLDLNLGNFSEDGKMNIDEKAVDRVRRLTEDADDCKTCFCRWSCAGGCHVKRHCSPGSEMRKNFCIQTRILTVCNLLDHLNCHELTERFMEDPIAQEKAALQKNDTLKYTYDNEKR